MPIMGLGFKIETTSRYLIEGAASTMKNKSREQRYDQLLPVFLFDPPQADHSYFVIP
jgi:hypothetical protein